MPDGYTADPAALRGHGAAFAGYADRTSAIHQQLQQALDAVGNCWGADAAGQNFAAGHLPDAQQTLTAFGALPGRLADVGDRFHRTAQGYEQADASTAQGFSEG
jgi:uncharacterized protein YukE